MENLTLGSLFDGSGGFPLGGLLAGVTPVWASEVEPFAVRVTTKRLPFMKANTIVNGTNPGYQNGLIDTDYTVRRLTPVECARLQGFPDWWCYGLDEPYPAIQDVRYWKEVWDTYARVIGGCKPKTEKQVRKWLEHPHSDAAEYKLWGNGVALPCVYFVLAGIAYFAFTSDSEMK